MTSCRSWIRSSWVCGPLVAFTLAGGPARAQENTGSLSGSVTDEAGQSLAGATVTVIDEATGQSRSAATDARGSFLVTALRPGSYTIRVELTNFRTLERKRTVLSAADRLSLGALRLAVGLGDIRPGPLRCRQALLDSPGPLVEHADDRPIEEPRE